ncbi:N-acetyl-gamma-glutamyl-phosphate reductase [Candidatus Liberibacter americanus]|uniref:Acetylglutamate semialdehyde dehydrogenase n=1 Tax=Candidatus Liberibacter americanus str. Sao Paulo TaxID=1261131 RepID=U6B593_9HYPH|nr:N-acetyl-gamma-glutamyl-phosphate reductase [Candidatus Liberibacter americanus]AHA28219.1 Acetylglutamate semialdehyde dehydrogenase [Candidatus Liberibacter americanus str. Sao Paulo]EMS36267.1 N-acetyl-gamma-glutamyl-phosphate reductase [Candidatus Liberibacter americanus PW_SP]
MYKIFVDGEHGTTGLKICDRIRQRRDLQLLSLPFEKRHNVAYREDLLSKADVSILCLPEDASLQIIKSIEKNRIETRIIDTSTAHRTSKDWIYGFPEMDISQTNKIRSAKYVSNPGCYATAAISILRPLRKAKILPDCYPIIISAISGYTGGGKKLISRMEKKNIEDTIKINHFFYSLDLTHKHLSEITKYGLIKKKPIFSPSVGRFPQGIVLQIPLYLEKLSWDSTLKEIHNIFHEYYNYKGQDVISVIPLEISSKMDFVDCEMMVGSDKMNILIFGSPKSPHINIMAVLDNLGKGASGAAIQNMDIILSSYL